MVCGDHPFFVDGMDQVDVFEAIIHEQHMPVPGGSKALCQLVDGLLDKEPTHRLGMLNGRVEDIMSHKCFHGMGIKEFRTHIVEAPWILPRRERSRKERNDILILLFRFLQKYWWAFPVDWILVLFYLFNKIMVILFFITKFSTTQYGHILDFKERRYWYSLGKKYFYS
jgi:hypothetical protein